MEFARNPTKTAENTGKMIIRFFLALWLTGLIVTRVVPAGQLL
jgi:hypothetical protein